MDRALFNTADMVLPVNKQDEALSISCTGDVTVLLGESLKHLSACIGTLERERIIHFVTYGKWSMHQLIIYLLGQIGPSNLYMTSWSMTEQPLRSLLNLKMQGLLLDAHCILSDRVVERTPKVFDLAQNVFSTLRLIKLHAKVSVLQNDEWCICVVGSANFTTNPRVEAGILDTHSSSAEFHKEWILNELAKSR